MMNKIVYDKEILKAFIDILPDLKAHEVYFTSMSCRNKYLNAEERAYYQISHSEMFAPAISRDKEKLFRNIHRYETSRLAFTGKTGIPLPDSAMVCYLNINPSSSILAYKNFRDKIDTQLFEMIGVANPDFKSINKLDKALMDSFQISKSRKAFIDFDFDISHSGILFETLVLPFITELKQNGVRTYVITSKSGYHILLDHSTINYNYIRTFEDTALKPLQKHMAETDPSPVKLFLNEYMATGKNVEIVLNTNNMIPVPGTFQAGYKVNFYKV